MLAGKQQVNQPSPLRKRLRAGLFAAGDARRRCSKKAVRPVRCKASLEDEDDATSEEQIITLMGPDGIVRFPGRYGSVRKLLRPRLLQPLPSWEEQKLCIGACFQVAATNGYDPTRRINIQGFCQSVDLLFESVEGVVMLRGGDILEQQRQLKSGLHEELKLIVALPLLWGVPPTLDCLRTAIEVGGGIVDKVYHRWDMYHN